jgi:hypothetical protein
MVGYFELTSRTALAYSSVAFRNSALRSFASRAPAFLSASRTICTLFSAALTSSMVDMANATLSALININDLQFAISNGHFSVHSCARQIFLSDTALRLWGLRGRCSE